QNRPNPWNNSTIIPFQLDPGGDARLTVYDMAGKLVYEVANYFPEGYHEISISRTDLPAIGLFYYTLEAGEQRATRKMVLTD
ncbi:MAG: T9SS type A sorting domain-containing protein, partial [Bacteroidota bacterium]